MSADVWEACAAIRRRNGAHLGVRRGRVRRYALTGIGHCHRCGSSIHGSARTKGSGRSWSYYVCRRRYGSTSCDQPLAPVDDLEAEVRAWLEAIQLPVGFQTAFAKAIHEPTSGGPVRRSVGDRRKNAEGRLARLRDLFEMGDLGRPGYIAQRDKIAAEIRGLDALPTAEPLSIANAQLVTLVDDWDAMTGGQRRDVLETIFSSVEVEAGHIVSATPRAGWLNYLETVCATRGWWGSNPRGPYIKLCLKAGHLVPAA